MRTINHSILICLLSCSTFAFAHTYQGQLQIGVFDDFKNQKSTTVYQLRESDELYTLNLPASVAKDDLLTGDDIIIDGQEVQGAKEKTINVNTLTVKNKNASENSSKQMTAETRKIITLLVNFTNLKATSDLSIADVDKILYSDTRSMRSQVLKSSFNQVTFIPDTNGDGKSDIYTVNLNYAASGCNPEQWARDARTAAARLGVNMSLYRHQLFVLPYNVSCNWGGYAYVGCGTTCSAWVLSYRESNAYARIIFTHELSHNLGVSHSSLDTNNDGRNDSEYGDAACVMGSGDFRYFKEMNAPHRDQLRWFNPFPGRIATVTSGSYVIKALESGATTSGLLAVRVRKNANATYYVSYRKNIGVFGSGAPTYLDKVNIHYTKSGDLHSYFVKALGAGQTFVDSANNVRINIVRTGATDATVRVN